MKRKTKAELQAELDAANKRIADLTDALIKAVQAQPVYVPYVVPQPIQPVQPLYPRYVGTPGVIVSTSDTVKIQ